MNADYVSVGYRLGVGWNVGGCRMYVNVYMYVCGCKSIWYVCGMYVYVCLCVGGCVHVCAHYLYLCIIQLEVSDCLFE